LLYFIRKFDFDIDSYDIVEIKDPTRHWY